MKIKAFAATARITAAGLTNGGIAALLPNIGVQLLYLIPLLAVWRALMGSGFVGDMNLSQMLTYTLVSSVLAELMVVRTPASQWNYEGLLINLYARPFGIFTQLIAQTVGGWMPMLCGFALPMLILSPLFGIHVLPVTAWALPSLLLCISLGFAIDFIFACLTIRMRGAAWLVYSLRMAVVGLFSGTVIPFRLLPFGLDKILVYQPFGSLGGAFLSVYTGIAEPLPIIAVQILWNVILWPVAIGWFSKSREVMMSFGG